MSSTHERSALQVHRQSPEISHVEIGPSKHAANALAGAFALVDEVIVPHEPSILDFQRYMRIYESLGAEIARASSGKLTVETSNMSHNSPDEESIRNVRASILLLSGSLLKTGHIRMPIPEGDWPGSRPTSSTLEIARMFGANVQIKDGFIDARLDHPKKMHGSVDVKGKVFATLAAMILATGVGGKTIIKNPLSSLEVDNLADFLQLAGAHVSGLDTNAITIQSDGILKLSRSVKAHVAPDACETMFWLAYAKLHGMRLEMSFPGWKKQISTKNWGPLFDMRGLMYYSHMMIGENGRKAVVYEQDIQQLEPVDIVAFHDKKGLPRDAAPVLAVLFGALNAISSYYDDKYGDRRIQWMKELRKIGGRVDYFFPQKATIWGNEKYRYQAPHDGVTLEGTDIRSAASLLLAASTSDVPVRVTGLHHIERSYTQLPEKMAKLGTAIEYSSV